MPSNNMLTCCSFAHGMSEEISCRIVLTSPLLILLGQYFICLQFSNLHIDARFILLTGKNMMLFMASRMFFLVVGCHNNHSVMCQMRGLMLYRYSNLLQRSNGHGVFIKLFMTVLITSFGTPLSYVIKKSFIVFLESPSILYYFSTIPVLKTVIWCCAS